MASELDKLGDIVGRIDNASPDSANPRALPDTGARSEFETGAVRDASIGKGFFYMIPQEAEARVARRFEDGATKYGPDNWRKGIPLSRYYDAIRRHLAKWALGHVEEDHLGAVGWNFCAAVWTEREIYAGRLPSSLNDLPDRGEHNRREIESFLSSVAL